MTDLPAEATWLPETVVDLAARACPFASRDMLRRALKAAAPAIRAQAAAAERERIRQLAEQHKATCKECRCATGDDLGTRHYVIETSFADLLREDTP